MPTAHTVILTHEHADFDALASLLGASLLFPRAIPVLPRSINRNGQAFIALYKNQFPFIEPKDMPRGKVDLAIVVDTRRVNATRGMDEDTTHLVIDHHTADEPLPKGWTRWEDSLGPHHVGANTTLLVEKLMVQQEDLSPLQATLLALGIYEDTGNLVYKSTTHRDARCAAWLLEQGANLEVLNRFIHYPLSQDQLKLSQQLSDNSEHLEIAGQSIVVATANAPEFKDELSALAHKLRELYAPAGLFIAVSLGDRIQVVARSTTDAVDVGKVAEALGGGGHTRAAAALVRDSDLQTVRRQIVELLDQHTRPPVTVSQIMSRGKPQTLSPFATVKEATQRMRRYGHEGFPVVEEIEGGEQLVGLLTRRDADRAADHRMDDLPVHKVMRTGEITVQPDASIEQLHRLMIDSDWGQIPVVDAGGRLIGIVTRTDLIKLWGTPGTPAEQIPDVSRQLNEVLTSGQHRILRMAGETASQAGHSVYVVGGFVRDLLLYRQGAGRQAVRDSYDMDIVVEGDAIELVKEMEAHCGGRVVTHKRFGTAKWILDDPDHAFRCEDTILPDELPPSLDFVTARTEFYTEPTVLPTVAQGSIKLDLHRRDFTINTLAIALTPDRWGNLLDFYGGVEDLNRGLVRVLHSLSFVDDPTRILRGVRYEQRFDFQIEERTLELLLDAVELIDRVSPARVRQELERILQEQEPEKALRRLNELGVLAAIHPELRASQHLAKQFRLLRAMLQNDNRLIEEATSEQTGDPIERLYWGILVYPLLPDDLAPRDTNKQPSEASTSSDISDDQSPEELDSPDANHKRPPEAFVPEDPNAGARSDSLDPEEAAASPDAELIERLMLRGETKRLMQQLRSLKTHRAELTDPSTPVSRVTAILDRASASTCLILSIVVGDPLLTERVEQYVERWQHVRPALDGGDLRRMGIEPGPIYGDILGRLRAALLDGEVETEEDQYRLARELIRSGTT